MDKGRLGTIREVTSLNVQVCRLPWYGSKTPDPDCHVHIGCVRPCRFDVSTVLLAEYSKRAKAKSECYFVDILEYSATLDESILTVVAKLYLSFPLPTCRGVVETLKAWLKDDILWEISEGGFSPVERIRKYSNSNKYTRVTLL